MTHLVLMKAFGDYVIGRSSVDRLSLAGDVTLVLGQHLLALDDALGSTPNRIVIQHGEDNVPALYDVRKAGAIRSLKSLIRLRSELRAVDAGLALFDRVTWRESIIWPRSKIALPKADNIYHAYHEALRPNMPMPLATTRLDASPRSRRIAIFPGSRVASKAMPGELVDRIALLGAEHGDDCQIYVVQGEHVDCRSEVNALARSFELLIDTIGQCDLVISADSLPAHLAEHLNLPVFVLSPVDNQYWLPLSAYQSGSWALFEDAEKVEEFIARRRVGLAAEQQV